MFQVKTKSTDLMISVKRATALISAAALSLFGLVATSTAANAAPVTSFSYVTINRLVTNNETTLRPNETLSTTVAAYLNSFSSDGAKTLSANHGITTGISGVTYGQKSFSWFVSGTGCSNTPVMTATVVPCANAEEISVRVFQTLTNTTNQPITITTNATSAKFTYGGVESSASNAELNAYLQGGPGSSNPSLASNVILATGDLYLNGDFSLCLDSTKYATGETLTWEASATINGNAVPGTSSPGQPSMVFRNGGNALADIVVSAQTPTSFYPSVNGNNLGTGTLAVSIDLKKGSTSVLKTCSYGPPPMTYSYPSSLSAGSVAGSPSPAFTANQNLLANSIKMDLPQLIRSTPDGNGGYFYVGPNATAQTKTDIVRLKTSGGSDGTFGGSGSGGKIQVATGTDTVRSFGWYADKSKWAMITASAFNPNAPGPSSLKVISGTTRSKTTVSKAMGNLNTASICGTGLTAGSVTLLSMRSASPIATVSCNGQSGSKTVLVSIAVATGSATKLADLGTAGMNKCTSTNRAVNPDATASTQQAALLYTTVSSCGGMNTPTVDSRSLVTVTVGGRISYNKALTTNPFGETEPTQIIFGPGKTTNTWLGSTGSFGQNGPTFGKLFTVSSNGTIKTGRAPVIPAANADWEFTDTIAPIKELSSTKWLVVRMGFKDGTEVIAPATLNPSTGILTTGKATKYTYMDTPTSRNILMYSMDATARNMYFYAVTSSSKYSVAKWTLPTS